MRGRFVILVLAFIVWLMHPLYAQLAVLLEPSVPSPARVGSLVTWTAKVTGARSNSLSYRFIVHSFDGSSRIAKDFGPDNFFQWSPSEHEGAYTVEVTVIADTGERGKGTSPFTAVSNVVGGQPVVNPTSHPLVMLYSAPPCTAGATMTVYFLGPDNVLQNAPAKRCDGVRSMNFYIAGVKPLTSYFVKHIIQNRGDYIEGPVLTFESGEAPDDLPVHSVELERTIPSTQNVLLSASIFNRFVATDLNGDLIWYYPESLLFLTRPVPGGYFFGIHEDPDGDRSRQIVRLFDLAGVTLFETNAARISEQLLALGKRPISGFHHEARYLSNGNILVLAANEEILNNVQGPGPVNIVGDMILVLNQNLEVIWTWDAFDHLDVHRLATQDDKCNRQTCTPLFLAATGNDWVHGNSLAETPDGNLLYSSRSQDWVIKLRYSNGQGLGQVIWKLGKDGDFRIVSSDPNPWFSHQHDPEIESDGLLSIFDNSNLRQADVEGNSRGQVFRLDEVNRVAELVINADLGFYAFALGSAQRLQNGNYSFDAGFLPDGTGLTVEVNPSGSPVYSIRGSAPEYRTFRMRSLYNLE